MCRGLVGFFEFICSATEPFLKMPALAGRTRRPRHTHYAGLGLRSPGCLPSRPPPLLPRLAQLETSIRYCRECRVLKQRLFHVQNLARLVDDAIRGAAPFGADGPDGEAPR